MGCGCVCGWVWVLWVFVPLWIARPHARRVGRQPPHTDPTTPHHEHNANTPAYTNRLFPSCGFSNTAVRILDQLQVEYATVDVLADDRIRCVCDINMYVCEWMDGWMDGKRRTTLTLTRAVPITFRSTRSLPGPQQLHRLARLPRRGTFLCFSAFDVHMYACVRA